MHLDKHVTGYRLKTISVFLVLLYYLLCLLSPGASYKGCNWVNNSTCPQVDLRNIYHGERNTRTYKVLLGKQRTLRESNK